MSLFESLVKEYPEITIKRVNDMPKGLSGLYFDNSILLNKNMSAYACNGILAEEIGHHETTYGDITDLSNIRKMKLEIVARRWGYQKITSLETLIDCYLAGHRTIEEVCVYLEITPYYLKSALDFYKERYGTHAVSGGYKVWFDPLNIEKI